MTPGFSATWPASVRCTGWLGRICNDLRRLKNKCRNLQFAVDITAYVMQSLRMTNEMNAAKQKMVAKISTMDTIELSNLLCKMAADMSDEVGIVLEVGMEVMEGKMSQADFIRFCGQLERVTA